MELHGIVQCATEILESGKAWLHVFLSDDDSSNHVALHHSIGTRIQIENTNEWPVDNKGKKLKSTGKLPAHVAEPNFPGMQKHRWRVYGKHLFEINKRNSNKIQIS